VLSSRPGTAGRVEVVGKLPDSARHPVQEVKKPVHRFDPARTGPNRKRVPMNRTITVEHNGSTYYGKVARIKSTHLGTEDHGILTAYLHCEGDGWGIGVGGYGLDQPVEVDGKFSHREPTAYGFDHILQMARTVGADSWEKLPGREVIVLFDGEHSWGGTAKGIAHISDEKRVMILAEHADEWKAKEQTPADAEAVGVAHV
jgi:hypothetical protein